MSATVTCDLQEVGRNVSRTVRMLIAFHDVDVPSVAGAIGMTPDTFYRRLKTGAWGLSETARLATYFGIRDINRLALGRISPALTSVDPERSCMNSLAMTFEQAS